MATDGGGVTMTTLSDEPRESNKSFNKQKSMYTQGDGGWDVNQFAEAEAEESGEMANLKIAEWMVKCPCILCSGCFVILILCTVLFFQMFTDPDFLANLFHIRSFYVEDEPYTTAWEAFDLALYDGASDTTSAPPMVKTEHGDTHQHWFKATGDKMFTPENVKAMVDLDNEVHGDDRFDEFCMTSPIIFPTCGLGAASDPNTMSQWNNPWLGKPCNTLGCESTSWMPDPELSDLGMPYFFQGALHHRFWAMGAAYNHDLTNAQWQTDIDKELVRLIARQMQTEEPSIINSFLSHFNTDFGTRLTDMSSGTAAGSGTGNMWSDYLEDLAAGNSPQLIDVGQPTFYRSKTHMGQPFPDGPTTNCGNDANGDPIDPCVINDIPTTCISDCDNCDDECVGFYLPRDKADGSTGEFHKWIFRDGRDPGIYMSLIKAGEEASDPGKVPCDGELECWMYNGTLAGQLGLGPLLVSVWLAFFAFIAVFILMSIHVNSAFVGMFGMFQVLASLPCTYIAYGKVLGLTFSFLNIMSVFVVLGIGADDMFIFYDAFIQSKHIVKKEKDETEDEHLVRRLSFTYRRAGTAMTITTVTTCVAFLSCVLTPLSFIRTFGVWASLVIFFDFLLSITLFPIGLIISVKYPFLNCCCDPETEKCDNCCMMKIECCQDGLKAKCCKKKEDTEVHKFRPIERFFGRTLLMQIDKVKIPILAAFVIVISVGIWSLTEIRQPQGSEGQAAYPPDHPYQLYTEMSSNFYVDPEQSSNMNEHYARVVWGVSGIDRDGTSKWNLDEYGKAVYTPIDTLGNSENQQWIVDICDELQTDARSDLVKNKGVDCFMDRYRLYRQEPQAESNDCTANSDSFKSPTSPKRQSVDPALSGGNEFPAVFSADEAEQRQYFLADYQACVECGMCNTDPMGNNFIKLDADGNIKMAFIMALLPMGSADNCGNDCQDKLAQAWFTWRDDKKTEAEANNDLPPQLVTTLVWNFVETNEAIVSGAIQGIIISIFVAFFVVLIFTNNWKMSLIVLLIITGICLNVFLLFAMFDWLFGFSEAVGVIVVIGFSVDYTVHFAHAYLEATSVVERHMRTSRSFTVMGVSVVYGAITTAASAFFLCLCPSLFFKAFGNIILGTIVSSFLWALLCFPALLMTFGPRGDSGYLPCANRITRGTTMRKSRASILGGAALPVAGQKQENMGPTSSDL